MFWKEGLVLLFKAAKQYSEDSTLGFETDKIQQRPDRHDEACELNMGVNALLCLTAPG